MFDGNVNAAWNQQILRNLKAEAPELCNWSDEVLLREWDQYSMCEKMEGDTFLGWMQDL